ncbi:LysE family translocator [Corynebacterium macginleyi]|uniref:LysE family translocator n=2 Tax=Corynebacterium macginleyi TaxID=38290 RepID=UPI000F16040F|nr:LysE family translocator [Corynebacterium macginleyi]RMB64612.1 LysE family translocator [Corynebacterium macginleyi]
MVADFLSWTLVMAMPGPDIISIGLQTSRYGLRAGFWTALGAALGVAVWSVLSLVGIEALLIAVPSLRIVLPMVGCGVLVILGVLSLRDAAKPVRNHGNQVVTESAPSVRSPGAGSWAKSLRLGFITNISNPKALVFFTSFFTQMMSHYTGSDQKAIILGLLLMSTLVVFIVMSVLLKAAAHSPLARIPAVRFLPGIIFIFIGVFYLFELI